MPKLTSLSQASERSVFNARSGGAVWILHLDPELGPAGLVRTIESFRDDALAAEFAGMLEPHAAVVFEVINVPGTIVRPPE